MSAPEPTADQGIEVRTYFARGRNALVARAEFSELYAALYLHQMDAGLRMEPDHDQLLRDALAAITLHCAARPRTETIAWTVNFQHPLANVFVTGSNSAGTVVGNIFTENIKHASSNMFYADTTVVGDAQGARRSVVEFDRGDFFQAAEIFYQQSEQRRVRFFRHAEEDIVLVAAQPDCDLEWLEGLDEDKVRQLDREVELGLLEQRHYRFECGCNHDRMLAMLAPVMQRQPEELFEDEEVIRIHCPRCGRRHTITRESLEAYLAKEKQ